MDRVRNGGCSGDCRYLLQGESEDVRPVIEVWGEKAVRRGDEVYMNMNSILDK